MTSKYRTDLLEICIPPDSTLGVQVGAMGGKVTRMGLFNLFDFSRKSSVDKAKEHIRQERPR
eukprot:6798569-Pyramimonas_sp.AAC.1